MGASEIIGAVLTRDSYLSRPCLPFPQVRFLPCEVASLVHLETLYLKTDPSSLAKLPDLDNLTSLKSLELQQVPLRPQLLTLPPSIGKLKNLTRLALCHYSIRCMGWVPSGTTGFPQSCALGPWVGVL